VHVLVAGCTWTLSEIWALTFPLSAQMSQHVKEPNGLLDAESIGLYAARMSRRLGFYDRMQRDPMDAVKQPPSRHAIVSWADFFRKSEDTHCSNPLDHVFGLMGLVCPEMKIEVDYTLTPHALLAKVLHNCVVVSHKYDDRYVSRGLEAILEAWPRIFSLPLKLVPGLVDVPFATLGPKHCRICPPATRRAIDNDIRAILKSFQIPLPAYLRGLSEKYLEP
jgi:hypothetical protein